VPAVLNKSEQIRTNPNKPIIGLLSRISKDDLLRVSDPIAYMYVCTSMICGTCASLYRQPTRIAANMLLSSEPGSDYSTPISPWNANVPLVRYDSHFFGAKTWTNLVCCQIETSLVLGHQSAKSLISFQAAPGCSRSLGS